MRGLAAFIMRGRFQAIAMAALFGVFSITFQPLSILAGAVIGLVILRHGWLEGLIVMIVTGVVIVFLFPLFPPRPALTFPIIIALFIPVYVCSLVLRKTESQGSLLLAVGGFVAFFIVAMHMTVGDVVEWWQNWLIEAIKGVPGATLEGFESENTIRLMNGFMSMLFGIILMLTILLARWWQSLLYNPGGFAKEFRELTLPRLLLPAAVAIIILADSVNRVLMSDLFICVLMIYFFQGLAVIHDVLTQRPNTRWWIAFLYICLIFIPQYIITGLALLGVVDGIVKFRKMKPKNR